MGGLALVAAIAAAVWWLLRRNQSYGSSSYAYAKTGQYGASHFLFSRVCPTARGPCHCLTSPADLGSPPFCAA